MKGNLIKEVRQSIVNGRNLDTPHLPVPSILILNLILILILLLIGCTTGFAGFSSTGSPEIPSPCGLSLPSFPELA